MELIKINSFSDEEQSFIRIDAKSIAATLSGNLFQSAPVLKLKMVLTRVTIGQ